MSLDISSLSESPRGWYHYYLSCVGVVNRSHVESDMSCVSA
jgi:hypothetical protein